VTALVTAGRERQNRDIQVGRFRITSERAGLWRLAESMAKAGVKREKGALRPTYLNGRGERFQDIDFVLMWWGTGAA
jgi:hypothetical protein